MPRPASSTGVALRLQTMASYIFWPGQGVAPGQAWTNPFRVGGDEE